MLSLIGAREIMAAKARLSLVATLRTKASGLAFRSLECIPEAAKFHVNESVSPARHTSKGPSNLPVRPGMKGLPFNPSPVIKPATGYAGNAGVGERRANVGGRTADRTRILDSSGGINKTNKHEDFPHVELTEDEKRLVHGYSKQQLSGSELRGNTINYRAIKAALDNERKLQGEVRQTYIELLQRFPYIRRIFRFQDMQDPDEDEFEEEVPNIACFLLDSIEETATTEEHDRLLPKVELLLKNRVIGMAPPLLTAWASSEGINYGGEEVDLKMGYVDTSTLSSIVLYNRDPKKLEINFINSAGDWKSLGTFAGPLAIPPTALQKFALANHKMPTARRYRKYFRAKGLEVGPLNGTYSRVLLYKRVYKHLEGRIKAKEANARGKPTLGNIRKAGAFLARCSRDLLIAVEAYDLGGPLISADKAFTRVFGPALLSLGITVLTIRIRDV